MTGLKSAAAYLAALLVGALIVALAFAVIMFLGWFAVHVIGRPLFHYLPAPIAYLLTAAGAALAVYSALFALPGAIRSAIVWARHRSIPRGTNPD